MIFSRTCLTSLSLSTSTTFWSFQTRSTNTVTMSDGSSHDSENTTCTSNQRNPCSTPSQLSSLVLWFPLQVSPWTSQRLRPFRTGQCPRMSSRSSHSSALPTSTNALSSTSPKQSHHSLNSLGRRPHGFGAQSSWLHSTHSSWPLHRPQFCPISTPITLLSSRLMPPTM